VVKRNQNIGQELQGLLGQIQGISSIGVNTVTGSILIKYTPQAVSLETIMAVLNKAGYLDPSKTITNDQYISAKVLITCNFLWKAGFGAFIKTALAGSKLSVMTRYL